MRTEDSGGFVRKRKQLLQVGGLPEDNCEHVYCLVRYPYLQAVVAE